MTFDWPTIITLCGVVFAIGAAWADLRSKHKSICGKIDRMTSALRLIARHAGKDDIAELLNGQDRSGA